MSGSAPDEVGVGDESPERGEGNVGWVTSLSNGSRIASARLEKAAARAKRQALGTEAGQKANSWKDRTAAVAGRKAAETGSTETGKKVARSVRKFGQVLSKVPGMGAVGDSAEIRSGVDVVTEAFKADPKNPDRLLHLSLALGRRNEEMRQVRLAKTVMKPQTLITRTAMRTAATLDAEPDRLTMEEKALRAAYKRCMAVKKARPTDADNLHTLSRVFLVQKHTDSARKLARLSLAAAPTRPGEVYVTLGYIEQEAGALEASGQYARLAVEHGSSLGHAVLADLVAGQGLSLTEETRRYSEHRSGVVQADEISYYGVPLEAGSMEVLKKVYRRHRKKTTDLRSLLPDGRDPAVGAEINDADSGEGEVSFSPPADPSPAWCADPTDRFQYRWWDGTAWTEKVADGDRTTRDPLGGPPERDTNSRTDS